jgi:hypothetical protein
VPIDTIDTINTIVPIRLIINIWISEKPVGLVEGVGLADVDEVEVTAAVSFDATYANW